MSAEPEISIRPSSEEDYTAIADIADSLYSDRPPLTVERYRAALRSQPPEASAQSFVAELGGHIVGHLWLNRLFYVPNPHSWYEVHPAAQGRGAGGRMFQFALDQLTENQAQSVRTYVHEDHPVARAFAARRGFRETGFADRPSRLEVRSANTELSRNAVERVWQDGIRIATQEELGETEEVLRGIHALVTVTYADMPASDERTPNVLRGVAELTRRGGGAAGHGLGGAGRGSGGGRGASRAASGELLFQQVDRRRSFRPRPGYRARPQAPPGRVGSPARGGLSLHRERRQQGPVLRINTDMGYRPLPANLEMVKDLGEG